jgi:hypothetical protein
MPWSVRGRLPLPDGRVNVNDVVSGYTNSGFVLSAGLALLAACCMGCGLLRLIATVMLFVVRDGLCDFFRGKFALASKMQYIVCNVGFHGVLLN